MASFDYVNGDVRIYDTMDAYKDYGMFQSGNGVCYIGELAMDEPWWHDNVHVTETGQRYWLLSEIERAGIEETGAWTRQDVLELCDNRPRLAEAVFDLGSWESLSTVLDQFDEEDFAEVEEREAADRGDPLAIAKRLRAIDISHIEDGMDFIIAIEDAVGASGMQNMIERLCASLERSAPRAENEQTDIERGESYTLETAVTGMRSAQEALDAGQGRAQREPEAR